MRGGTMGDPTAITRDEGATTDTSTLFPFALEPPGLQACRPAPKDSTVSTVSTKLTALQENRRAMPEPWGRRWPRAPVCEVPYRTESGSNRERSQRPGGQGRPGQGRPVHGAGRPAVCPGVGRRTPPSPPQSMDSPAMLLVARLPAGTRPNHAARTWQLCSTRRDCSRLANATPMESEEGRKSSCRRCAWNLSPNVYQ